MITQFTVENFKALRQVRVDLAPFTVLIGPNDTGKTSFLEAVFALAESARHPLAQCFWSPWQDRELVYKQTPDTQVRFAAELAHSMPAYNEPPLPLEHLLYSLALSFYSDHVCKVHEERVGPVATEGKELTLRKNSHESSVSAHRAGAAIPDDILPFLQRVAVSLPPAALARWDVEELAMPSRLPESRRYPFDPCGYGLATCIAEMKLGRGGHFESLRDDFCDHFRTFQDIVIKRTTAQSIERTTHFQKHSGSSGEGHALVLLRKDGVEVPAGLASGGTLVTLAYLTLLHLQEPRKLLLIEEPENALHPGRLNEIVPLLRRAVTQQRGCQIILTTHSPLLLDYVDPSEVRVFLRNEQDDVEVYNLGDVPDIRERLRYLMLGELVYNEGEQELVKEIQQHAHSHSG